MRRRSLSISPCRAPLLAVLASLAVSACDGRAPAPVRAAGGAPSAGSSVRAAALTPAQTATATAAHGEFASANLQCASCHPCGAAPVHGLDWMDRASAGFHAFSANQGLGACQGCHGAALDGVGASTPISCAACHGAGWQASCTMCHGGAGSPGGAPPRTTWGNAADPLRAGAHASHVAASALGQGFGCDVCHTKPLDALTPGHIDGSTATVRFTGLAVAPGLSPAWDRATGTCANVYCHGATLAGGAATPPSWIDATGAARACGGCHGAPPPTPSHARPDLDCGACHGPGDSAVAGTVAANHLDGTLDVTVTCTSCHGDASRAAAIAAAPPADTRGETATAARGVGAHQAHLRGGTLGAALACADCHEVPADVRHASGTVELRFGARASLLAAAPRWDPATLTCSGTYCHGAVLRGGGTNVAPSWTGGPSQVACGSCHGAPPPWPHPHTTVCDGCHPGYTVASVNLATHMNGKIEAENLTCSSCHGDNTRVLTMGADPNAIAAPPYGSRGETDPRSRSVGQHQAHVNIGNAIALPNKCRYCHVVPTATGHSNGVAEVTFGSLATMGGATPTFDGVTCSNTYCHGATLNRGGTDHAPRWIDPAPVTCGSCHGVPPPLPHPQDSDCIRCHPGYTSTSVRKWTHVNGISDFPSGCNSCHDDPPSTGAHYEHLQERVTCDRCHAGYTMTSENPALHRNAVQDVTLPGWDPTHRTCSNVGCHGSEYWGRNGTAARQSCNQCHGVPPDSGGHREHAEYACSRCHGTGYSTTSTNVATHMNGVVDVPYAFYDRATLSCGSAAGACHGSARWGQRSPVTPNCGNCHGFPPPLPHPQDTACQSCHPSMLASGVLTASHNNGTLDVSGKGCQACHGFPPTATRSGGAHPADANCYGCHSTTVDPSNQVVPNGTHDDGAVQVGGGGVGTYGCQACHGDQARTLLAGADPNAKAAPPLGTRGETEATTRAVGAHLAHLDRAPADGALARPAACAECHVVPTAMDHANGVVVNTFGGRATLGGAAPVFDEATLSCASTYCHGATLGAGGTNHAPFWVGGVAQAGCGSCHGAPPPAPHPQNASCGGCHDGYTSTSANLAAHVDGVVQVSAAACNSCHGSAANAAPPAGLHGETATSARAVGAHQAHLAGAKVGKAVACGECHPVPTSMSHSNAAVDVTFGALAAAAGATPAWNGTTCSGTYCHGATLAAGGTNHAPAWTVVDGTQDACGTCHLSPPPAPHVQGTACGGCHDGYTATTVNLALHVDGKVDVLPMTCSSCHGKAGQAATAASPLAAAPPVDVAGSATGVRVGAHQKHLAGGSYASAMSCQTCHASVGTYGASHADGVRQVGFTGAASANLRKGTWTAGTGTAAGTCGSTWCHGAVITKSGGSAGGTNLRPAWTNAITSCAPCHGTPPSTGHHSSHSGRPCGDCHSGYSTSTSSPTTVNKALHVNGVRDVGGTGTRVTSWNGTSCSTSCHGSQSW